MDPTASIIAIVDKAWVIVKYLRGVKQGSQERRILALEVSGVHAVTANLQAHLSREGWDSDTPWTRSIRPLLSKDGVLDQLRSTLVQIADKLAVNPGARLARTAQALKWPFEKKEVQDLVDRIQRLKSDINQALTQANLEISKETNTGVSYLRNCAEEEEFKTVTAWLCSLDARVIQSSEQKQPIKGTGQWFLHDPRFQAWTQGRSPVLWCHGIPGAGKTMLASAAFNHMAEHARGSDVARLIVFCSFDEQRTHTALDILSSLLRQTVELQGRLDDGIKKLYTYHVGTQKPSKPDVDKVHACLDKHLARFKDTFIILDGLDEMPKAEERSSILQQLERLSPRLKLLVTSRPLPQIRKWFVEHGLSEGFHISPKNLDSDEGPRYCDKYHQYNQRSLAIYQCPGCQQGFCATCFDTMNRCDKCNTEKEQWLSVFGKALTIVAAPDDLERYINWRIDGSHTLRRYISTLRRKGRDLRQEIVLKVQRYAQKM
ncbi:hypothetical protein GGR56DRAFT_376865 [Xylariaceae sp. FL0804]|nr:hypothetical protein GGR56DRAFT_376865 [Xylariaceae sp. FL0804]